MKVKPKSLIISMIIPTMITVVVLMILLNSFLPSMVGQGSAPPVLAASTNNPILSENTVLFVIVLALSFVVVQFFVLTILTYRLVENRWTKLPPRDNII